MYPDENDPIAQRMASLSDEELQRVVTIDAADWQPEAQDAARAELRRRGVTVREALTSDEKPRDKKRPYYAKGIPITIVIVLLIKVLLSLLLH